MRNTTEQTAYIMQLKHKRKKAQKRMVWAALAACLVVVAGVVPFLTGLVEWPFAPETSEIAFLSWDGAFYSPIDNLGQLYGLNESDLEIVPGKVIGQVTGYGFHTEERQGLFSNVLKKGTTILEWPGYTAQFRVCSRDSEGRLRGFERSYLGVNHLEKCPVSDLFNFQDRVAEILICNNNPSEIGRITDRTAISRLMQEFADFAEFTGEDDNNNVYQANQFYRLYLRLADNSVTEIVVNLHSGFGSWVDSIRLPEGFAESLSEYVLGPMVPEWLSYGNLSAHADYGLFLLPEAEGLIRNDLYAPEDVWIDGTTGHLYLDVGGDDVKYRLADDALADVRIEGQNIYYLTQEGQVERLRFAYPNDPDGLRQAVEAGDDLSTYVTARDVLADGPFNRLQVRLGVIWTLSRDGILCRNGQKIAEQVTSFALDPLGVTYSDGQAIWRQSAAGQVKKLADRDAVSMAVDDIYLYYAPSAGGVWKMRLDGLGNRLLYNLNAQKIVVQQDVIAILERDTGRIFMAPQD
ncbi:MAG TPA: hypothetical protein DCM45_00295, partial [Clostridiales bacterium]|nr:hypothetical protein [Clostridiales bacterium]